MTILITEDRETITHQFKRGQKLTLEPEVEQDCCDHGFAKPLNAKPQRAKPAAATNPEAELSAKGE